MSALVRFKAGDEYFKARIFERGSRKGTCSVCDERSFGILVRFISPLKGDMLICERCVVLLAAKRLTRRPEVPILTVKPVLVVEEPEKKVSKWKKAPYRRRKNGRPGKPGRKRGYSPKREAEKARLAAIAEQEKLIDNSIKVADVLPPTDPS